MSPTTLCRELRLSRVKQLDTNLLSTIVIQLLQPSKITIIRQVLKSGLKIGTDLVLAEHLERKLLGLDDQSAYSLLFTGCLHHGT